MRTWSDGRQEFAEWEKDFIREFYADCSNVRIAEFLGRSLRAIEQFGMRAGLKKVLSHEMGYARKPWLESECQLLRDFYNCIPTNDIAAILDRSFPAVLTKAGYLGLSGARGFDYPEEFIELKILQAKIKRKIDGRIQQPKRRKQPERLEHNGRPAQSDDAAVSGN